MYKGEHASQEEDIIADKFSFVYTKKREAFIKSAQARSAIVYSIDTQLIYEPFFQDFGPLNLGKAYRFCEQTSRLLREGARTNKKLILYAGPQDNRKANAAVLVGIYQLMCLKRSGDQVIDLLKPLRPFVPFRDASCGPSFFKLTVEDCIKGIEKARDAGLLTCRDGSWDFECDEYEYHERVENGDLNWIVPNKVLAFSGPAAIPHEFFGFHSYTPEDHHEYFKKKGVTAVVRLNKKIYDRNQFLKAGFRHYELYFLDGSCPTRQIVTRFLEIMDSEPGAVAVHCKAGLGRTGVLICCYLMKRYHFTAHEAIGYIRICRPGSVIGLQQNFVSDNEGWMWRENATARYQTVPPTEGHQKSNAVQSISTHNRYNDLVKDSKPVLGPPFAVHSDACRSTDAGNGLVSLAHSLRLGTSGSSAELGSSLQNWGSFDKDEQKVGSDEPSDADGVANADTSAAPMGAGALERRDSKPLINAAVKGLMNPGMIINISNNRLGLHPHVVNKDKEHQGGGNGSGGGGGGGGGAADGGGSARGRDTAGSIPSKGAFTMVFRNPSVYHNVVPLPAASRSVHRTASLDCKPTRGLADLGTPMPPWRLEARNNSKLDTLAALDTTAALTDLRSTSSKALRKPFPTFKAAPRRPFEPDKISRRPATTASVHGHSKPDIDSTPSLVLFPAREEASSAKTMTIGQKARQSSQIIRKAQNELTTSAQLSRVVSNGYPSLQSKTEIIRTLGPNGQPRKIPVTTLMKPSTALSTQVGKYATTNNMHSK